MQFHSYHVKMVIKSKRGVVTSPYLVGFLIGLVIGLIIGSVLTYMVMSGNLKIPFVGG